MLGWKVELKRWEIQIHMHWPHLNEVDELSGRVGSTLGLVGAGWVTREGRMNAAGILSEQMRASGTPLKGLRLGDQPGEFCWSLAVLVLRCWTFKGQDLLFNLRSKKCWCPRRGVTLGLNDWRSFQSKLYSKAIQLRHIVDDPSFISLIF